MHGSVFRFEGQVTVFWPSREGAPGPCYRCLYPEPPPPELAPSCAGGGRAGHIAGRGGGFWKRWETIKILLGAGDLLVGRLLHYDAPVRALHGIHPRPATPSAAYCADGAEFPGYIDYQEFCALAG